jgi:hypothetical protein
VELGDFTAQLLGVNEITLVRFVDRRLQLILAERCCNEATSSNWRRAMTPCCRRATAQTFAG